MSVATSRRTGFTELVPSSVKAVTITNGGPSSVALSNGTQLASAGSTTVDSPAGGIWVTVPPGSYADVTVSYGDPRKGASTYTYNTDGTVASETVDGVSTSYSYNTDGTVATSTRQGSTLTYAYNADGTIAAVS